ncbi:hypothetical protein [Vibrio sp. D431a]|uniref:hypothetical protein n=1 Tax=Vibrio sp. D431a TaxID=2837388 RepID=UPI0025544B82|nr:hypothetical protein [Vibrio sp. D431a]MDK9793690.1 hypothetical protein [Vibrio sp. D431a]
MKVIKLSPFSKFRALPVYPRPTDSLSDMLERNEVDIRSLESYPIVHLEGVHETPFCSSLIRFLKKGGIQPTILFYGMAYDLTLAELKKGFPTILKYSKAKLIFDLRFKLNWDGIEIFNAECDTLDSVPENLIDEVLSVVKDKNPEIEPEELMAKITVKLKVFLPMNSISFQDNKKVRKGEQPLGDILLGYELDF